MRAVPVFRHLKDICLKTVAQDTPFVVKDVVTAWPALQDEARQWSIENLLGRPSLCKRVVPVEFFGNYMDPKNKILQVTFGDLIEVFRKEEAGEIKDDSLAHIYLAQYELKELPELEQDCLGLPSTILKGIGRGLEERSNVWFGKKGVSSPAHTDPFFNLLCQVRGTKNILLFPFETGKKCLYPARGTQQENTSLVEDLDCVDKSKYPLVTEALDKGWHVDLQEGDALYVPKKIWHFTRNKTLSFSVNYWWI